MTRILRLMSLALAVSVVAPAVAHAQDKAPLNEKERSAKAREAYDAGKRAYNLGDFDQAIKLWRGGYEYKDDAIFLYNIAQAYRQLKDFPHAIFYYKGYLREKPTADNRAEIEAKIADLQKMIDEQQNAAEGPPKGVTPPGGEHDKGQPTGTETPKGTDKGQPKVTPIPRADEVKDTGGSPGKGMKLAGIVSMSAGGALLVTGIIFSFKASGAASDLETATRSGQPWSQALSDQESSGKTDATIGAITVSLGAAALVGGGVLYFLGMKKDAKAVEQVMNHVTPQVGPRTAGLVVRFNF